MTRRELATRKRSWARALAAALAARGATPNAVSVTSVLFALVSGLGFLASGHGASASPVALLIAAACIQLRLLCNMLDGMLAVEGGLQTPTGDVFNELPDRLADVLILAGAGYAIQEYPHGIVLGWAAAALALLTAYIRALSGSLGLPQRFLGPMAKQHRMFALTVATLAAAAEAWLQWPERALPVGLAVIVAGTLVTSWRRAHVLLRDAEASRQ